MKKMMSMAIGILLTVSFVGAFDRVYDLSLDEFEDLQISEGGITLNNFSLAEDSSFMSENYAEVQVSFSIRNRNADTRIVTAMIVGRTANSIIWAVDASPLLSRVSANKTEVCTGSSYVSPGTVKPTTRIWLRVVGNF